MAYQNFYPNLAGVRATFRDGILNAVSPAEAPSVIVVGTATKGRSYTVVGDAGNVSLTSEFGSNNSLTSDANLIRNALNGARTIGLMKVGGKKSHLIVKSAIQGYYEKSFDLIVSCNRNEDDYLDKVKLMLLPFSESGSVRQRIVLVDEDNNFLFDSESLFIADNGQFDIQSNLDFGIDNIFFTPNIITSGLGDEDSVTCTAMLSIESFTKAALESLPRLSDNDILTKIYKFDNNDVSSTGTDISSSHLREMIQGDSGTSFQSMNRLYAAGEMMYDILREFNSSLFVATQWRADLISKPITSLTPGTAEALNYDQNALGYMWKKSYRGVSYPFIFGRKLSFDSSTIVNPIDTEFTSADGNLTFKFTSASQIKLGDLLNLVEFHFHKPNGLATSSCVEVFSNGKGRIECHLDLTANEAGFVVTPFGSVKVLNHGNIANGHVHRFRPSLVNGTLTLSNYISSNESFLKSDPFIMTPFDLTGELVPDEILSELLTWSSNTAPAELSLTLAKDQIREINLAHQIGQLAYKASTTFNSAMGVVGLTPCPSNQSGISNWAGTMPTYTIDSLGAVKVSKDGSGILGNKFLYGQRNYRNDMAYGGFILTKGNSLPDAEPYGIDDTDEAVDAGGYPIDLGKYLVIVGATGTKSIQISGTVASTAVVFTTAPSNIESSRGNLAAAIAAKIFQNQENQEPLGPVNGLLTNQVTGIASLPSSVLNALAIGRIVMCDPKTLSVVNLRTAALPTSDYTRVSTIRVANRLLSNVRNIAIKYLGSNFSLALQSLESEIDGYLRSEVSSGMIQGTPSPFAQVYASRVDQISGKLNVRLRFTPPFALESIQVDIAVQPPTNV